MNRSEELFSKIDDFLAGALSEEEKNDFEAALAANKALALEVEKHRVLKNILKDRKILSFKKELKSIASELEDEEKTKYNRYRYVGIAAAIIVLLGIGGLWWSTNDQPYDMQALYSAYYSPFPVVEEVRSETLNQPSKGIVDAYSDDDYLMVIQTFEKLDRPSVSDEVILYAGISYLETAQEAEAIAVFHQVSDQSGYYEDAVWYQILTYLKLKDQKNVSKLVAEIIAYNGRYLEKAMELKEKIKSR